MPRMRSGVIHTKDIELGKKLFAEKKQEEGFFKVHLDKRGKPESMFCTPHGLLPAMVILLEVAEDAVEAHRQTLEAEKYDKGKEKDNA